MAEFNDLDVLLYEPTESYDIGESPLLDVRDEEEARVDTFSPIDSPTKELIGDFTAPDLTVRREKLPGSLPETPEFPQSSPLSHLKPDSPVPSSFGLENTEFQTPAPAVPQTTIPMPLQFIQNDFYQRRHCDPQHHGDIALGHAIPRQEHPSSHALKQQTQTCQENGFSTSLPAGLPSATLNLPTDKRLTRRGRWELATAQCLQLLPETILRKITVDVLSHMEPPILQQLASWADVLDKKASRFNVEVPNPNCGPCHVSKEYVDARTDDPNSQSVAQSFQEGGMVGNGTRQPVYSTEDPIGVDSEPGPFVTRDHPGAPNPLQNASVGGAIKLETMLDTATQLHMTQVEVEHSPLNIYPTAVPLVDLGPTVPSRLLQPTVQCSVLPGIRKTVKRRAPLSKDGRGRSSRKEENRTKKPKKTTARNIASDDGVSSRYTQTWKQTLAQKEARENATKSKAKRKLASIGAGADPCEPNSKRVAVASDSSIKAAKPMSEAAKFIAQKHLDVRRRNMERRWESAQNGQQGSMIQGSAPSSTPSRFCHLCTRTAKMDVVLVCKNVSRGTCRKVVCFRCVEDQSWNLQALLEDQNWTCTHCRNVSTHVRRTPNPYNAKQ